MLLLLLKLCATAEMTMATAASLPPPAFGSNIATGNIFETFTPITLSHLFGFSDRAWHINEQCLRDIYDYFGALQRGTFWAVKLYDASSYYSGNALDGKAYSLRLQSSKACHELNIEHRFNPNRNSNHSKSIALQPFSVQSVVAQFQLKLITGSQRVQQHICLPRSCYKSDLMEILQMPALFFQRNHIVLNSSYLSHRIVTNDYSIFEDQNFYVIICLLGASLIFYIVVYLIQCNCSNTKGTGTDPSNKIPSTLKPVTVRPQTKYDNDRRRTIRRKLRSILLHRQLSLAMVSSYPPQPRNFRTKEFDTPTVAIKDNIKNRNVRMPPHLTWVCILNEISVQAVLEKLCDTHDDADNTKTAAQSFVLISCTILMIYAHITAQLSFFTSPSRIDWAGAGVVENPNYFFVQHSSYIIDIYFFICGLQLAQQFLSTSPIVRSTDKTRAVGERELNIKTQLTHIARLFVLKIICLAPIYLFSMYAALILDKHFHSNIILELPSFDYDNCEHNKLGSLFYLDSFWPLKDRCMPWTWFLSLELQFFVIACLVLLLSELQTRFASVIASAVFLLAMFAATCWQMRCRNFDNQMGCQDHKYDGDHMYLDLAYFNLVLDNVYVRVIPYQFGILLGYVLEKLNKNMRFGAYWTIFVWTLGLCIAGLCVYVQHSRWLQLPQVPLLLWASFVTMTHVLWAGLLCWLLLTAAASEISFFNALPSKYFRFFCILERLSPICWPTAPLIIRWILFAVDDAAISIASCTLHTSAALYLVMCIGSVCVIYASAALLYVLLAGPVSAAINAAFNFMMTD